MTFGVFIYVNKIVVIECRYIGNYGLCSICCHKLTKTLNMSKSTRIAYIEAIT